ncbi:MAG: PSD1 and planctomycete cytochrome C domain-containing protein [Gemmataceae bacterium]|nr:PSD1 and planctomycete cytochrome C domain-containing protein [Gemmataceae bacterium]
MRRCSALVVGLIALGIAPGSAGEKGKIDLRKLPPAPPGVVDFQRDIKPIFARACIECHGPSKQRAGLRLDGRAAAMQGGNSGAVIHPGQIAGSRLLHVVAGLDPEVRMPPKERPPLTAAEVGKLRAWIEQGAKWPAESAGTTTAKSDHWAFRPIRRAAVPTVSRPGSVRNAIDAFILARLEKEKLAPSPEADRATLIRRLSLDLLGLPPSPREVEQFLADTQPGAYERLVERLLASPHYGERWGRHWLDLARYADSDGYEADRPRPYAWRYRNWVIDALNRDLPFDRFAIEQLAGDLLPGATLEQKTATGFHRNTLTNREGGTDKEQFRVEAVVDRVNTTAKVFLGMTLGCAQCHDHKYDPFSQREYYQLFAFFNSDDEVDLPAALPGEDASYRAAKAAFDRKKADLQAAVTRYRQEQLPAALDQWERSLTPEARKKLPAAVVAALAISPDQRNEKQTQALLNHYGQTDAPLAKLTKSVTAHERNAPKLPVVPTLALGPGRKTHVLLRGDFLRPGVGVQPGTPGVLPPLAASRTAAANRLDLARWLVAPDNPLTSRVIVNWVWQRYFGRGLVATLEDFGTQGERPSHPELLDYLAGEFMRRGWGLKDLHRLIVTSATYRQSSRSRPGLRQRDPLNVLLARQSRQRLEAEILRDNALAASGLLHRAVGGPSVKPPQPAGISELTYAGAAKWVESKGADRYRRGLYTWFQRTSPHPMLMTFDAPDGVLSCVRRERSNTPLQALTLLNDTVFVECAQGLARRVLTEKAGTITGRIEYAFRLCLARRPDARALSALGELYHDLLAEARANPTEAARLIGPARPGGTDAAEVAAWVGLARTLLNLDEFVTRE